MDAEQFEPRWAAVASAMLLEGLLRPGGAGRQLAVRVRPGVGPTGKALYTAYAATLSKTDHQLSVKPGWTVPIAKGGAAQQMPDVHRILRGRRKVDLS